MLLLLPSCAVVGCEHLQTLRYMLWAHTHDIGHTYIRTYVCACVRTHIHVRTPSQKLEWTSLKLKHDQATLMAAAAATESSRNTSDM